VNIEQLAQGCYTAFARVGFEPVAPLQSFQMPLNELYVKCFVVVGIFVTIHILLTE